MTCESDGDFNEPYVECGANGCPSVSRCGCEAERDIGEEISVSEMVRELPREWKYKPISCSSRLSGTWRLKFIVDCLQPAIPTKLAGPNYIWKSEPLDPNNRTQTPLTLMVYHPNFPPSLSITPNVGLFTNQALRRPSGDGGGDAFGVEAQREAISRYGIAGRVW